MKPLAYYLDPVEQDMRIYGEGDEPSNLAVKWQEGPIDEAGVNGVLPEDVIQVAIERLRELNVPPYNTRESSLAITALEDAQNWLLRRRINRMEAGTLGTSTP